MSITKDRLKREVSLLAVFVLPSMGKLADDERKGSNIEDKKKIAKKSKDKTGKECGEKRNEIKEKDGCLTEREKRRFTDRERMLL